jgi:hypothetical protein
MFEINYGHSEHTVKVTGTPVSHTRVFAVSVCNGSAGIRSIVAAAAVGTRVGLFSRSSG